MIDVEKIDIFKNNLSALKETSKDEDNDEFMTLSTIQAVNFDKVTSDYVKDMCLCEKPKSNDALYISKNGDMVFIEFKNGNMEKKIYNIRLKIFDSLLILNDILNVNITFTRSHLNYILVYNESKNPPDTNEQTYPDTDEQAWVLRGEFYKYYHEKRGKKKFIRFNLDRFEKLYFNEVFTYTEAEFENKFVNKYSI